MKPINTLKQAGYDYYASMQKTANYDCKSINPTLISLENVQKQQSHKKTLEIIFLIFKCILIATPLSSLMIVNDPLKSLLSNFLAMNLIGI